MIQALTNLSNIIVPVFFFYIIAYGLIRKRNVYDDFISGAVDGAKTVVGILPTLIGLLVAVGILRASGFFEFLERVFRFVTDYFSLPSQIIPLIFVRLYSSSAATGILLDLYQNFGTDSYIGLLSSIMMSASETVFYTMSIYFMAVGITKTRWTLKGALLATLADIVGSIILTGIMV